MEVKIDTKEKFHVITPIETALTATMTDGIKVVLNQYLKNEVRNLVLNLSNIENIEAKAVEELLQIQQAFYENNASFVVCCLQKNVEAFLNNEELLELFNVTPTESEAWDIVQMEEIEREFMDEEETGEGEEEG
ncbi:MAG: STAS domain-containing protein [Sphingobacteriales bacterium]|jgi:anti-anti-sigma factor|nr:STAS domain-containing protein [Sphingobacteriales bacterium]